MRNTNNNSVYLYTSACCGATATKPALVKPPKGEDQTEGLGKWHCSDCGRKCKVTVSNNSATN